MNLASATSTSRYVFSVYLMGHCRRRNGLWVGGKCTAADLVFVPYMWSMEVCQNVYRMVTIEVKTMANPPGFFE